MNLISILPLFSLFVRSLYSLFVYLLCHPNSRITLSLFKRIPVPILGKFTEDYRFSNAFSSAFTRHSGIFYMSLKGGIQTAVLREAYKDGVLIDQDPLLEMKDIFVELLEEGWKLRAEELRLRREVVRKHRELMPLKNQELQFQSSDEELSSGEEKMW
uniref:PORR domain-containing protein n=1 Tax=Opuntia streptacantha TaxID=393608 RepID=A0A7C9EP62_OPUST